MDDIGLFLGITLALESDVSARVDIRSLYRMDDPGQSDIEYIDAGGTH